MNEKLFINDAEKIIPPVNDSPYERILAIGDVHGAFDKLESLLEKISPTENDLVIFLGDYFHFAEIKRKNLETLLRLAALSERKNFIFLLGNTDETAMQAFFGEPEVSLKSASTTPSSLSVVLSPESVTAASPSRAERSVSALISTLSTLAIPKSAIMLAASAPGSTLTTFGS